MEAVVILCPREQDCLLGAIEAAVEVRDLRQFFRWTQGPLQTLLPHQLMLCMQFDGAGRLLRADPVHAGLLDAATLRVLTHSLEGLVPRLAALYGGSARLPAITGGGRRTGDAALHQFRRPLQQLGFDHLVVHGSGRLAGTGTGTLFALCGWQDAPTARHAYFLSLLLPHLHLALLRVAGADSAAPKRATAPAATASMARPLSARELEILGWVREGKSNAETGIILGLSPVTVKTHLQRIYRALGVSNRTHALARCIELRLLAAARAGA